MNTFLNSLKLAYCLFIVLPLHVAWYQSNLIGRKWALAVATSIIVDVFESKVIILVKEGFLLYLQEVCFTIVYI